MKWCVKFLIDTFDRYITSSKVHVPARSETDIFLYLDRLFWTAEYYRCKPAEWSDNSKFENDLLISEITPKISLAPKHLPQLNDVLESISTWSQLRTAITAAREIYHVALIDIK